ncbi:MAG: restriction endonuclease subunit S, partial [Bacteroidota bacterium]|nr:restriction endonuclease subunit S [Bacteroidota bacterium]
MNQPLPSYPDYKPAGLPWLDKVPAHWEIIKVKRLFKERSEKGYPDEPLLAATQKQGVVLKTMVGSRTVEASKDFHLLKLVRVGDFVISLRSFEGGIEYAYFQGIISPAYNILVPAEPANASYLAYLLKSKPFVESLTLFVTGIREGQNIDNSKFNISFLPIPPLPEQRRIVAFLNGKTKQIARLLRNKRQLIKLLTEQKQALIHRAVTQGLDTNAPRKDSGVAWLGEVPAHWQVRRIKYILREVDLRSTTGSELLLSMRMHHGLVPYNDHFERPQQSSSLIDYKLVKPGQLVINRMQAGNGVIFFSQLSGLV